MSEHGELVAREVKAFGFNTTLAPVMDLATAWSARVMGTRSAPQERRRESTEYGRIFLSRGWRRRGWWRDAESIFPALVGGHGLAPGDAGDSSGMDEMESEDLVPYRELAESCR